MHLIIDTTEFYRDPWFKHVLFAELRSFIGTTATNFVVPQIVHDETLNHYRLRYSKLLADFESASNDFSAHVNGSKSDFEQLRNTESALSNYEKHFAAQLKLLKATIIPYDEIRLAPIVRRSLLRRKPFDGNGKNGFRDTIIWETLLKLLREGASEIVFVTSNKNDFGGHKQLAAILREELVELRVPDGSIEICEGLHKFIEEYVRPSQRLLESIKQQIQSNQYSEFNAEEFWNEHSEEIASRISLQISKLECAGTLNEGFDMYDASIEFFSALLQLRVSNVRQIDDDQIGVGLDIDAIAQMKWWENPYEDEDESEEADHDPSVGKVQLRVEMEVVVSREYGGVVAWDVRDFDLIQCRYP